MPELLLTRSEKTLLANKGYRIFKLIGFGTDSRIYLANFENPVSNKRSYLACKVYNTKKMPKEYVEKFLPREINTLMNISHPYIVQIQSIFKWKAKYYIFMRYAERGDLFDYIKENGRLEEPMARTWFRQACLAIKYLHDMDIIHRDLKCENLLLTRNFNIKLADFGFARSATNNRGEILECSTYCGSLSYTAPEILRGTPYIAKPVDMWSMGVILFIMVNGSMPFYEENLARLYKLEMHQKWRFKRSIVDFLSDSVKSLIINLLNPDVDVRYNIHDVLHSDWMTLESSQTQLTPEEQKAALKISDIKINRLGVDGVAIEEKEDSKDPSCKECVMIKEIKDIQMSDGSLVVEEHEETKKKCKCCVIL